MAIQVKCVLELGRKDPLFFSGEQIKGIVHLESETELSCCSCKHIEFLGVCGVNLNKKEKKSENSWKFYSNLCWDLEQITDNAANENKCFKQKLKFKIQLINQLPTSCKAKYGFIEYKIVFSMEKFKKNENTIKFEHIQPITVIRTLNPNNFDLYKRPWIWHPIPLLSCTINHQSFVPGECVHYTLTLKKHFLLYFIKSITISLQEVIGTRTILDQCKIYIQNSPHKQYSGTLSIPKTTVTSFKYPIYPLYTNYFCVKIQHLVNITVNGRFTFRFKNGGYNKSITIATVPMIKHNEEATICDSSKKEVEKSTTQHHFECLPDSSCTISPMTAFIPKYSIKEGIYIINI